MLAETRVAADRITMMYMQKFKYPYRFAQLCEIPGKYQTFCRMAQAFAIGSVSTLTLVRSGLALDLPTVEVDGQKQIVAAPWMPWAPPDGWGAAPRDISHLLAAIGAGPVLAEIEYVKGLGEALIKAGDFKMAKKEKWPVFELIIKAKKEKTDTARALTLTVPHDLQELHGIFVPKSMAPGQESVKVHLRSVLTGGLMQAHAGTIEWRGADRPVVIRSACGDMISFVQAGKAPDVAIKLDAKEDWNQAILPGLYDPKMDKELEATPKVGKSLTNKEVEQRDK